MSKQELIGRRTSQRGIIHLYTKKSDRLWKIVHVFFLVIFSPLWLPFYVFTHIGGWSEILLEKGEDALEWFLGKIIPKDL